jgi:hypothetical protein
MFYLTKRIDERQCSLGERCMVLADFSGIPAGTKGKVVEIYEEGIMIEWEIPIGKPSPSMNQRFLRDGFSRGELEYLAFATYKHPRVSALVAQVGIDEPKRIN